MKNRKALCCFALLVFLGGTLAQGDDFWEKNPFQEWSLKDCQKLLKKSPWSQSWTFSSVHIDSTSSGSGDRTGEMNPRLTYRMQFRSALPIRQAMVRSVLIQAHYDEMTGGQKEASDARANNFLHATFPDSVLLYVTFEGNVRQDVMDLSRHWRIQTVDTLKNFVYLRGGKGRKVTLQSYSFSQEAGNAFQFIFPRTLEGEPLAGPEDKSLQLEFVHPNIRNQGERRVLRSFKVKDMLIDGALVY